MVRRMPRRRRVALLCGSARTVLAAVARELARNGIGLVIQAAPDELAAARRLSRAAQRHGVAIRVVVGVLGGDAASRRLIDEAGRASRVVDAVILCVGEPPAMAADPALDEWDDGLAGALRAPFFLAKHAALRLGRAGGGRLVLAIDAPESSGPLGAVAGEGLRCMVDALERALPRNVARAAVFGGGRRRADARAVEIAAAVRWLVADTARPSGTVVDLASASRG
jgi:NAD(P)-dependent dehydrogenase (short-subunit alcohol dehydrogenase family)